MEEITGIYTIVGWVAVWLFILGGIALAIYMSWWTLIGSKVSFTKYFKVAGVQFLAFITQEKSRDWILTIYNVKHRSTVYHEHYISRRKARQAQERIFDAIGRYAEKHDLPR